jgi:SAM-dependent methyltransferase
MRRSDTFDPTLFEQLRTAEENHCWFVSRRKWILERVSKHLAAGSSFLEVGCGTGNVSSFLAASGYSVIGCEFYHHALCMAWPGFTRVQGSGLSLPFRDNSFDAVGLFDVLEHFDEDLSILSEAARAVRKGGVIFITVPARRELWSSFDDFSSHRRRYHPGDLKELVTRAGLSVVSLEYLFLSLYLPARISRKKQEDDPFAISDLANAVFGVCFEAERIIPRALPLPLGTSLLAVARKTTTDKSPS